MSRPSSKHRLEILDYIRGVAAFAVLWFHFTGRKPEFFSDYISMSGTHGWLGVTAFFVLSAIAVPMSLVRANYMLRHDSQRFMLKRYIRLTPPLLVSMALAYLLMDVLPVLRGRADASAGHSLTEALYHLVYLSDLVGSRWFVPLYWTLAIEMQFYVGLALVFPLVSNRKKAIRLVSVASLVALAHAFPVKDTVFEWMPVFLIGITVFQYRERWLTLRELSVMLVLLGLSSAVLVGAAEAFVSLLAAVSVLGLASLQNSVLSFLGKISYSLYLVHMTIGFPIIDLGSKFSPTIAAQLITLAVAVAATLAASYVVYRTIELPSQRLASSLQMGARRRRD